MPSPASLHRWGLLFAECKAARISLGNSIHLWQSSGGQVLTAGTHPRHFSEAGFCFQPGQEYMTLEVHSSL